MSGQRLPARGQRGMSLLFALVALVALSVGAIALIRSVDSGVLALGNLTFKQSGVMSGGRGAETATAWLSTHLAGTQLDNDIPSSGYYATSMDGLDATRRTADATTPFAQVDWDGNNCVVNGRDVSASGCVTASAPITVGSDTVRYVITRLCARALPMSDSSNSCAAPVLKTTTESAGHGNLAYGNKSEQLGSITYSPYFRVITRTLGPKGTVAYTETLVHF